MQVQAKPTNCLIRFSMSALRSQYRKTIGRDSQKSLSPHVNAGRMRLLQYFDLVKVNSESRTRGIMHSVSGLIGGFTESEDGLQRRLKPNVVQRSIVFSNSRGDSFGTRSVSTKGPNIPRLKQVKWLLLPVNFEAAINLRGPKRDALKASSPRPVRLNLRNHSSKPIHFQ